MAISAWVLCNIGAILIVGASRPDWWPTPSQLRYLRSEIVALVHFNMDTYMQKNGQGDLSCSVLNWNRLVDPSQVGPASDPATFYPAKLNISQWAESMQAVGVGHSVLTAKHSCGFLLWPTDVRLSDTSRYNYSTAYGRLPAEKQNILQQFVDVMREEGLGHGFYYSLHDNYYMQQLGLAHKEFLRIEQEQAKELWTQYGNLTEIWFDAGYDPDEQPWIAEMLSNHQPNAVIHGGNEGTGGRITENPVAGCWNESTVVKSPMWSAGEGSARNHTGPGSRDGAKFCPKSPTWTVQANDTWFWNPNYPPISLARMVEMYHWSVGNNGVLELSWSPDQDGLIPVDHVARYTEFGAWLRGCYGKPLDEVSGDAAAEPTQLTLEIKSAVSFDRVILQEEIQFGQRVWAYSLEVRTGPTSPWRHFSYGTSIGHKKIDLGSGEVFFVKPGGSVRLTISEQRDVPKMKRMALYAPCSDGVAFVV